MPCAVQVVLPNEAVVCRNYWRELTNRLRYPQPFSCHHVVREQVRLFEASCTLCPPVPHIARAVVFSVLSQRARTWKNDASRRTVAAAQYNQATVRAHARQIELIQIPQVLMGISPLKGQVAPASPVVCQRRARGWHHLFSPRDAAEQQQKVLPEARVYSYCTLVRPCCRLQGRSPKGVTYTVERSCAQHAGATQASSE